MTRVRYLKPGEPIPHGTPRRYLNVHGYYRLRWKVAVGEYVEALEHRVVAGVISPDPVHHINHIKTDNRPENLRVISRSEHSHHHGQQHAKIDIDVAKRLYAAGSSTPEIGEYFGCHHVTVYRALKRAGVELRPAGPAGTRPGVLSEAQKKRYAGDPSAVERQRKNSQAMWRRRSPEERAAIGRRISEAKRGLRSERAA